MDRGKQFEAEISRSLSTRYDLAIRLEDGGRTSKNRQIGDFLAWDGDRSILVECKTTKQRSFPFANIKEHQIASLTRFKELGNSAYVVINYHGECDETFAIDIEDFTKYMRECGRKSMPMSKAAEIGTRLRRYRNKKGVGWAGW